MTVKELYVQAGQVGDYPLRRQIEEAVMQKYQCRWTDEADMFWEWYLYIADEREDMDGELVDRDGV